MSGNYILRQGQLEVELGDRVGNTSVVLGAGTASSPIVSGDANKNHMEFRFKNTATSGDNRGIYNRLYLAGAGGGGESLRSFTTVLDVAAGTAHGAHVSLNFNSTGRVTGLGVAMRATLHIPDVAAWAPGTIAALQPEIWSDGAASDAGGATELAFIRCVNGGHANGVADVDDDAFLFVFSGGTIGAGNLVQTETDETKFSHKIRCKAPDGTTLFLMACAT